MAEFDVWWRKKFLNAQDSCHLNPSNRTFNIRNELPAKTTFLCPTPIAKPIC
jgi:hypothetical protein